MILLHGLVDFVGVCVLVFVTDIVLGVPVLINSGLLAHCTELVTFCPIALVDLYLRILQSCLEIV